MSRLSRPESAPAKMRIVDAHGGTVAHDVLGELGAGDCRRQREAQVEGALARTVDRLGDAS